MLPRTLVPKGARPPALSETQSQRRRPTALDERTLVPSALPVVALESRSNIPNTLPLESIATRMVVPRDVNVDVVRKAAESEPDLPAQLTEMDSRITVPQGAQPPIELPQVLDVPEDLVEPDMLRSGQAAFLTPERLAGDTREELVTRITSVVFHILIIAALIFGPQFIKPHQRTAEEEEIARQQISVLLPPGALEALRPSPAPRTAPIPRDTVKVDPNLLRKIAPPTEPTPAPQPQPERPLKDLPSAPTPQSNAPAPQALTVAPPPKDMPAPQLRLETPTSPSPQKGLILPKDNSAGGTIRDAMREVGKTSAPRAIGGGGAIPTGRPGGGSQGQAFGAMELLTPTEGVDFNNYLHRVYITVRQNWFAVMPESVHLGDQGVVALQFRIMKNGVVPDGEPVRVRGSGKEPLDRAAISSIRASTPFEPLPSEFKGPYIELRFIYYYNLQPE